jgi:FixJ family two-component response regulator
MMLASAAYHAKRPPPMSHVTPIVFVVDDDVSVRESLEALIRQAGWRPQTFASAREEVLTLVVSGLMNKQAGAKLCISEITVKARRGQVMRKMQVRSLADLVKMAASLNLGH